MERKCRQQIKISENHSVKQYKKITFQARNELIQLVDKMGASIYSAAKELNINNSTAKAIIRNYRAKGHIFIRREETVKRKCQKNLVISPQPQSLPQRNQSFRPSGSVPDGFSQYVSVASTVIMKPKGIYYWPMTFVQNNSYSIGFITIIDI